MSRLFFNFLLFVTHQSVCVQSFTLNVSFFESLQFDEITTESWYERTNVRWIKAVHCTEGTDQTATWTYPRDGNMDYMLGIAPYALTIKFTPSDTNDSTIVEEYTVYTKPCSNPVVALNNLKEVSFTVDTDTLDFAGYLQLNDWGGSTQAKDRLWNNCGQDTFASLASKIFWSCGNHGIVLWPNSYCYWEFTGIVGQNIDVLLGFDADRKYICSGDGTGTIRAATLSTSSSVSTTAASYEESTTHVPYTGSTKSTTPSGSTSVSSTIASYEGSTPHVTLTESTNHSTTSTGIHNTTAERAQKVDEISTIEVDNTYTHYTEKNTYDINKSIWIIVSMSVAVCICIGCAFGVFVCLRRMESGRAVQEVRIVM